MQIYKDGKVDHYKNIFPNTSFPVSGPSDEFLLECGAYKVEYFVEHDQKTQKLVPCDPIVKDGVAYIVQVASKTAEDIAIDTANQSDSVRTERDRLLKESDWTQILDAPVDRNAWAAYRQALRDVPSQAGFPWDVQWPTKPE
jgi:hypothetical protein